MWVRPEELTGPRPAYKLDPTHPKRGRPRLQRRVPIGCDVADVKQLLMDGLVMANLRALW